MFGYIKGIPTLSFYVKGKTTYKNLKLKRDYSNDFHIHSHMLQIYNEEKKRMCAKECHRLFIRSFVCPMPRIRSHFNNSL